MSIVCDSMSWVIMHGFHNEQAGGESLQTCDAYTMEWAQVTSALL